MQPKGANQHGATVQFNKPAIIVAPAGPISENRRALNRLVSTGMRIEAAFDKAGIVFIRTVSGSLGPPARGSRQVAEVKRNDSGSAALVHLDTTVEEWIGLVALPVMGKTDVLFPRP